MRNIIIIFLLSFSLGSNAQIAKWIVRPTFDHIHLVPGTNIYKGGVNDSTYLWDSNGTLLLGTKYYIGPFVNNVAVVSSNNLLKGIVKTNGQYISKENETSAFEIDTKHPVYINERLLVQQDGEYLFIDQEGNNVSSTYLKAYPFHNNYATVVSYENYEKKKGAIYGLIRNDNSDVHFSLNGKPVKQEDITFVSTPNDQHKSLLIIKKDVYIYDNTDNSLVRLSTDRSANKKMFVSLRSSDFSVEMLEDGAMAITLDKGKAFLDDGCLLTKIELDGGVPMEFNKSQEFIKSVDSDLKITKSPEGDDFGIDWIRNADETIPILPPQFQDVSDLRGINAVVCLKDKFGIVQLVRGASFEMSLNDGKDVGFKHGVYSSNVQASLPNFISYNDAVIRSEKNNLCDIIPVSRTGADTREGNYLQYNCKLIFPEGIDENRSERTYYFTVEYEGLKSVAIPIKTKVWYIQQYDVDIESASILDENVCIQVNVSRLSDIGDDNTYWFNVDMTSDMPISKSFKKINEGVYEFQLSDLAEGSHNIDIVVNEDNCPPVKFPFVINYNPNNKKHTEKLTITKR